MHTSSVAKDSHYAWRWEKRWAIIFVSRPNREIPPPPYWLSNYILAKLERSKRRRVNWLSKGGMVTYFLISAPTTKKPQTFGQAVFAYLLPKAVYCYEWVNDNSVQYKNIYMTTWLTLLSESFALARPLGLGPTPPLWGTRPRKPPRTRGNVTRVLRF